MPTVIITRPLPTNPVTAVAYEKAGFEVFKAPVFDIETNRSVKPEWLSFSAQTWVILSVHALYHALDIHPDLKPCEKTQVIAVGPAVEKAWKTQFDHDITSHPWMNSEGVIELLKKIKPASVKILTTEGGRNLIKSHCMQQCISYAQINTYQRIPLNIDLLGLHDLYQNRTNNQVILTATSSGILQQFTSQLSTELYSIVKSQPVVVGAKRIADIAQELGFFDIHLAASPSDEAMCEVANTLSSKS